MAPGAGAAVGAGAGTRCFGFKGGIGTASRRIAEVRATERGLANMRFVTGVLEEVGTLAPGPYDYIDCCGVLHHLASPK